MTVPREVRGKVYALRALAALLLLFAAGIFIARPHDFGVRLLGLVAILLSVSVVRRSNVSVARARGDALAEWSANRAGRVGPLAWILVAASLLACGFTYFLMYLDQLHGGKDTWPVYAFAVAALMLVLAFGNVVARISR
jgi:hypothetical protein